MEFGDKLNKYIELLGCSAKELASESGLSETAVSRYRSGERAPQKRDDIINKLVVGIERIAKKNGISEINLNTIKAELTLAAYKKDEDYENFASNFSSLINVLRINIKDLSAYTNFEISYLYRIKSGQRKPNDLNYFTEKICQYVVSHYTSADDLHTISILLGVNFEKIKYRETYSESLKNWLYNAPSANSDTKMKSFLKKLEEFNIDEYIRSIHFDELKVPNIPFYKPSTKNYYGIKEMRKGELDFFKGVVLSKSMEQVFMCSDMPLYDIAEDMDFNKKWMFAIAMCIKKGLHLNIIHNIDRPFDEMMLGLEAWIPLYMTGQISPYCFAKSETTIYHHFTYVSGTLALTGECVNGFHANGKYYLTTNKEEVAYYKQRSKDLLSKAKPLMVIYTETESERLEHFLNSTSEESGNRRNVYYAPPIYTISDELLVKILSHNNVTSSEKSKISDYVKQMRNNYEQVLNNNIVTDELPELSEEEFNKYPVHLSLSGIFFNKELEYTYDEYSEHISLCKLYELSHENYTYRPEKKTAFRNIQIHVLENKYVHIAKDKSPSIHFVIRHPKIVKALTDFIPLVFE